MSATIIDGRAIAQGIKQDVAQQLKKLQKTYGKKPLITTVIVGEDPASALYLKLREKACQSVGITTDQLRFPTSVSQKELEEGIQSLNVNPNFHGILVQLPLPDHIRPFHIMEQLHPMKDVEGFHPLNMGKTMIGDEHLVPCTPQAVLAILNHEHIDVQGKNVVVVNHSIVVGKPLTVLLLQRNATVSTCHVFTKELKQYTKNADVIIVAAGVPGLITKEYIKKGAVIIDVGINQTKQGITGDVAFDEVQSIAQAITPVPGGVGPVTIACSLHNMMTTFEQCMRGQ